ncbi:MAG: hypothetical protein MK384_02365 [SAR202 cluster bacterium]|nr:hypothetical protein [SAR202 cluster bacterium]
MTTGSTNTISSGPQVLRLADEELAHRDWARWRFAAALALFAGGLGAASIIVNFLTQFEGIGELEKITFGQGLLFGFGGALAGMVLAGPFGFWVYGARATFTNRRREPRKIWVWLIIGGAFTLFYALIMGGFFLPTSQYFYLFFSSIYSVPNLVAKIFDLFTGVFVSLAVLNSFKLLYTAAVAGVLFGPGAWLIDRFNTSSHPPTSRYGPFVTASVIGLIVIGLATLAPPDLVARLGP